MTSDYQTVRPHAVQKCASRLANIPHWQQNRPPATTGTSLTWLYDSAVHAHRNAITHPMNVQPRNRFSRKIPPASLLFRPIIDGRKYSRIKQIRVSTAHPFQIILGTAVPPAHLYSQIRNRTPKCFPIPIPSPVARTSMSAPARPHLYPYIPAPCTFTSKSANFCLRSSWSFPPSFSAICVMFIEQNFGPHIEQNLASL